MFQPKKKLAEMSITIIKASVYSYIYDNCKVAEGDHVDWAKKIVKELVDAINV